MLGKCRLFRGSSIRLKLRAYLDGCDKKLDTRLMVHNGRTQMMAGLTESQKVKAFATHKDFFLDGRNKVTSAANRHVMLLRNKENYQIFFCYVSYTIYLQTWKSVMAKADVQKILDLMLRNGGFVYSPNSRKSSWQNPSNIQDSKNLEKYHMNNWGANFHHKQ